MTQLHEDTFWDAVPNDEQLASMQVCREACEQYARTLAEIVPDGADKTYLLRKLRELAMWADVAITRNADGSPRGDDNGAQDGPATAQG